MGFFPAVQIAFSKSHFSDFSLQFQTDFTRLFRHTKKGENKKPNISDVLLSCFTRTCDVM